jgi:peptidoglycan/xylan/chitin deacetylase (PgdA/CDA1 family)
LAIRIVLPLRTGHGKVSETANVLTPTCCLTVDRPMNPTARATLDGLLVRSPAQWAFHRRARARLAVLAYHAVDDPTRFAGHLDVLVRDAHPVTLEQVVAAERGRRPLPDHAVLVTFDDGARSVYDTALPFLRERGVPAAAFVVTGMLDGDEPYWWTEVEARAGTEGAALVRRLKEADDDERLRALAELRRVASRPAPRVPHLRRRELPELEAAGIAVGSHSHTHPCLPRCGDSKIRAEVADAHAVLTEALGHEPLAFAYPNGDCDARARQAVDAHGYELAFLFDHRLASMPPPDRLRVSRLRVDSTTSIDRFRTILSGLHPTLHRLRGGR